MCCRFPRVCQPRSEPVSLENEKACCETVISGCSSALAGYPTSAAEDELLLKRGGLDKRCARSSYPLLRSLQAHLPRRAI